MDNGEREDEKREQITALLVKLTHHNIVACRICVTLHTIVIAEKKSYEELLLFIK